MFQKTYGQWKPRKEYWFLESGAESVGKPRIEVHRRILVSAQIGGAMTGFGKGDCARVVETAWNPLESNVAISSLQLP